MTNLDHLKNVPIFADLSSSDLEKISNKMILRNYNKGQVILLEESKGETFFVIKTGEVKVTKLSDDGREVILAILGESEFFGEMSLLDGEGRSANIVANEDSTALTLSRNDFLSCLESYPKIAISLLEELAVRLRKSDKHIESLSLSDSEHRIGITIARLAEEIGTIKKGVVSIKKLPFQQDIANMAGTSRETVSRTIKLFEDKKILTRNGRALTIFDFNSFKKVFFLNLLRMSKKFVDQIRSNNQIAISKAITSIESGDIFNKSFLDEIYKYSTSSLRIGITGPPGAGKSTLTDKLIDKFLQSNKSVGVIAVDPTSPFTGGALLGDRVRMNNYLWNDDVFIRSLGARGELGGLSKKTQEIGDILAASGKDIIIYETVGVGQGEHDIIKQVDIVIVVLVPESGDEIQLMKAGIIEIGDIFVINKSDRQGSNKLAQSLKNILHSTFSKKKLEPEVFLTSADRGDGIDSLYKGIDDVNDVFVNNGTLTDKRNNRLKNRVFQIVKDQLLGEFWTSKKINRLNKSIKNINNTNDSPSKIAKMMIDEKK